ncbi:hypothetical protein D3C73_1125770 [compost metagenome]
MPPLVRFHRQYLFNRFNELSAQFYIFQIIFMQISHMHPHATANVAAYNRGGYIPIGRIPYRCCSNTCTNTDMHVRCIAHIRNSGDLQIVIGHLEHFIVQRGE